MFPKIVGSSQSGEESNYVADDHSDIYNRIQGIRKKFMSRMIEFKQRPVHRRTSTRILSTSYVNTKRTNRTFSLHGPVSPYSNQLKKKVKKLEERLFSEITKDNYKDSINNLRERFKYLRSFKSNTNNKKPYNNLLQSIYNKNKISKIDSTYINGYSDDILIKLVYSDSSLYESQKEFVQNYRHNVIKQLLVRSDNPIRFRKPI